MILTGSEIEQQVASGKIHISPFSIQNINPNSYNYRLSPTILEIIDPVINPAFKSQYRKIKLSDEGFLLLPRHLYLGNTLEVIGSSEYVPTLMGRSSLGRLGLFLQITADLGQLGTCHSWTLEMTVVQPLVVYPRMIIGQVCFWAIDGNKGSFYNGKYHKDLAPHCSELFKEFEDHDTHGTKNRRKSSE